MHNPTTTRGAVSAAAPRWSEQDEMAHIEDDIRTGEITTMERQYATTMALSVSEKILLLTILSLHKDELVKRLDLLQDEDMRRINQEWLDKTETLIAKVDQATMPGA